MRCFVAVKMPLEFSQRVSKINKEFEGLAWFKPVKAENMHITLLFLGDQGDDDVRNIKKAMDGITFAPFDINFDGVNFFGSDNFPKVIFLKGHSEYLEEIQRNMQNRFMMSEIDFDKKPFRIHLTLQRIKKLYEKNAFLDKIKKINKYFPNEKVSIENIQLIKSILKPDGPKYETVYNIKAQH